ncbi:hypothetical protein [Actinoplanes derwentensis]|uniref:hypothetical protein n=1 Tax=Actinoplanes derwentensis TaxID=113562 RepID=UPI001A42DC3C|nr:hypothetical protein [Actinoplanes derwentensis]GID88075.1 hypothetical protein Ade03nite_69990 [Actinoplanes derwentensis]
MDRRTPLAISLAVGTVAASALFAVTAPATAQPSGPVDATVAAAKADALIAGRPAVLKASGHDAFKQKQVYQAEGLNYVAYDRTYKGLPVEGGDLVVVTDPGGQPVYTSVAQSTEIGELSITPTLTAAAAATVAKKQLKKVTAVEGTSLVVVAAEGAAAKLA